MQMFNQIVLCCETVKCQLQCHQCVLVCDCVWIVSWWFSHNQITYFRLFVVVDGYLIEYLSERGHCHRNWPPSPLLCGLLLAIAVGVCRTRTVDDRQYAQWIELCGQQHCKQLWWWQWRRSICHRHWCPIEFHIVGSWQRHGQPVWSMRSIHFEQELQLLEREVLVVYTRTANASIAACFIGMYILHNTLSSHKCYGACNFVCVFFFLLLIVVAWHIDWLSIWIGLSIWNAFPYPCGSIVKNKIWIRHKCKHINENMPEWARIDGRVEQHIEFSTSHIATSPIDDLIHSIRNHLITLFIRIQCEKCRRLILTLKLAEKYADSPDVRVIHFLCYSG